MLWLTIDLATLRRLAGEFGLGDEAWRQQVAATRHAPPFAIWRRWLDRPVASDRAAFLGTSGFGPLDNIAVLERFEEGARRWVAARGGSLVELHAYALTAHPDEAALKDRQLRRIYPELAPATIVAEEWLVNDDCPLWGTDPWEQPPRLRTPHPRIVLAGDGIRCDFPVALMERASTTGFLAANQLLHIHSVAGHDLWTVPMCSRHILTQGNYVSLIFADDSEPADPGTDPAADRRKRRQWLASALAALALLIVGALIASAI
jgi:carotenoid phi-ring synthase / carotenoid chi-ring synthase